MNNTIEQSSTTNHVICHCYVPERLQDASDENIVEMYCKIAKERGGNLWIHKILCPNKLCYRFALSNKEHMVLVDTESLVWTRNAGEI